MGSVMSGREPHSIEIQRIPERISRNLVRLYEFIAYEMQYRDPNAIISYKTYAHHKKKIESGDFGSARMRSDKYHEIVGSLNRLVLPPGYSIQESHLTLSDELFDKDVIAHIRTRLTARSGRACQIPIFSPTKEKASWVEIFEKNRNKTFIVYSISAFANQYLVYTFKLDELTDDGIKMTVRQVLADSSDPQKNGGDIEVGEFSGYIIPKNRRFFMFNERTNNEEGDISFAVVEYNSPHIAQRDWSKRSEGFQVFEAADYLNRKSTGARPIIVCECDIEDIDTNDEYIGSVIGLINHENFKREYVRERLEVLTKQKVRAVDTKSDKTGHRVTT